MAASFTQRLKAFWETQELDDGETFVKTHLKPRGITNLGILLSLSTSQLEKMLPEFYLLLQDFVLKLSVDEQLLKEIGMDLATLLSSSQEQLAERFPIFHQKLQLYIKTLRIDEKFLNALGVSSRDFDTIKDNLAKENRESVQDLILGFDNRQQIIDRVIGSPSADKLWSFVGLRRPGKSRYYTKVPYCENQTNNSNPV